jgi:hypothetical protein
LWHDKLSFFPHQLIVAFSSVIIVELRQESMKQIETIPLKKEKYRLEMPKSINQSDFYSSLSHQCIFTPLFIFGYIAQEISNHALLLVKPNQPLSEIEFRL